VRAPRPLANRAGIIIIKDGALLLMHRIKQEQDFYCIPGGHVEPGETVQEAAMRELFEETTLRVHGKLTLFLELDNQGRREYYFLAPDGFSGTPQLSGEESGFNCATNVYRLEWVSLEKLTELTLYPERLHKQLLLEF
jgi:ADP-ribose pyrophosphatase YjhB (NUDIX family)